MLGENCITRGWRIQRMKDVPPSAKVPASQLAWARLHIDVAANSMEIERQRVDKGLPGVLAKQLGFTPDRRLTPHEILFETPALFVHFAMNSRVQLFAYQRRIL